MTYSEIVFKIHNSRNLDKHAEIIKELSYRTAPFHVRCQPFVSLTVEAAFSSAMEMSDSDPRLYVTPNQNTSSSQI
jgi:hypothetical protein